MTISVTLTNARHLAGANAAYTATIPPAPIEGQEPTPAPYESAQAYVQAQAERWASSWADTTGVDRIAVGAFVRRFPGVVMDAVKASEDPTVIAILAQLDAVTIVRLGHPTTTQGVGYLVAVGLLTQEQADAVLAY
jgi:hypothetical protein